MTDRIDLDDIDTDDGEPDDEPNRGDWFWQGEGDPADEPDDSFGTQRARETISDETASSDDGGGHAATPRVPRQGDDKPVGIPVEGGGAGSSPASDRAAVEGGVPDDGTADADGTTTQHDATGAAPHGEDADDMTMALTYKAAKRLAYPASAFADAESWADWVGIVGHVDTPVINRFQRQNGVDADFFSGTGTGPGERLAEVGPRSMFYAKRMVVVGIAGEDERVAAEADWEFVPLSEAAEKADWELNEE
ncbi:DUF7124 domain-containing protein [Haloplanus aerogenes]|uniref:DUF7124 domain-containing protein n=1 Tax=Haloplanus aerogenes TaxID=660522 RepID=A0A3M0D920_9EURY|nr:hypothetical protein [Haloplanus aerogenes]AZH26348.1 hypothetical protein DU502_13665 [Haloplanus aerogenes]RMB18192.1 hypothetical protein ATH50_1642 [Haloplanus aerogenes]